MDLVAIGQALSVWLVPVIVAITFHEAAHGWMAERLGDPTAKLMGRVTFNPIKHVDPVGTFLLPGLLLLVHAPFLFGWAKPVPVRFEYLNNPKRDMIWVALAGPGINLLLAFLSALALHLVWPPNGELTSWISENLQNAIFINVILAVFNMMPLLPLDGGRVLCGLLPRAYALRFARTERYGLLILLALLFLIPMAARSFGTDFNPVVEILWPPIRFMLELIFDLAGHPT